MFVRVSDVRIGYMQVVLRSHILNWSGYVDQLFTYNNIEYECKMVRLQQEWPVLILHNGYAN